MGTILTIIVFVLIFSLLVIIHELGHFWAAKRAGIKVEEFGFGLPPRIWGKKKGDTLYSINWIPFGGFVKLKGEDAHDPKMLKDPKSFSAKSKWQRFQVLVAGVFMNFVLAFVLLSFGFMVGMEPLIVDGEDFRKAIDQGNIKLSSGMVVKEIEPGSTAEKLGFEVGDNVMGFIPKGAEPQENYIKDVQEGVVGTYRVISNQKEKIIENSQPLEGIGFYPTYQFPSVKVLEGDHQWFTPGTVVVQQPEAARRFLSIQEFTSYIGENPNPETSYPFVILSPSNGFEAKVPLKNINKIEYKGVLVQEVAKGSPAEAAGVKPMDKIFRVGDKQIEKMEDLLEYTSAHKNEELTYLIVSPEKGYVELKITPDNEGRIGVYVTPLLNVYTGIDGKFTLYLGDAPVSLTHIQKIQYPIYQAPVEALKEMGRLSWLTAKMFGVVIKDLVSGQGVPETVSGPVGIYVATGIVVQEGLFATLRFIALLSLSLAVINILPFPALDGGRLLFLLIETVIRRRVPQKWEAYIHSVGFILLLLLILAVTYSDVLRFIIG